MGTWRMLLEHDYKGQDGLMPRKGERLIDIKQKLTWTKLFYFCDFNISRVERKEKVLLVADHLNCRQTEGQSVNLVFRREKKIVGPTCQQRKWHLHHNSHSTHNPQTLFQSYTSKKFARQSISKYFHTICTSIILSSHSGLAGPSDHRL